MTLSLYLNLEVVFSVLNSHRNIKNVLSTTHKHALSTSQVWILRDVLLPYSGITIWSYPNTSKIIWMNFIVYKLSTAIFMHIYSSRLTMMYFTVNHSRVGSRLHLKTSNTVIVYITALKITLKVKKKAKFSKTDNT